MPYGRLRKVFLSRHHADTLAAAACRCLYQKRIADFLGIFLCFLYILKNLRSGNNGTPTCCIS